MNMWEFDDIINRKRSKGCKCTCNTCLKRPWDVRPSVGKSTPYFRLSI